MGHLRFILGLLLAFCACLAAAAPSRTLRFERIGVEQGLAQESVLTILQDRHGYMWFGTQAGLTRSDGYQSTVFKHDPTDPASLVDNYVLCAFEDKGGRQWFGTKGGLVAFEPNGRTFQRYLSEGAQPGSSVNRAVAAIVSDGAAALWLATGDGLKLFDPSSGQFRAYRHDATDMASLVDDRVNALARDAHGGLWVGTAAGLDFLAKGGTAFQHINLGLQGGKRPSVLSLGLSPGPDKLLWVGTNLGLQAWHLGEAGPERLAHAGMEALDGQRILSLYFDVNNSLWVGTDNDGLYWRNPLEAGLQHYTNSSLDQHSLSDRQISAIFQDRSGTLWVGTWYAGVNRADLASGGFESVRFNPTAANGISNSKVKSVAGAGADKFWLGTSGGGLNLYESVSGKAEVWRHDPRNPLSLPDDLLTVVEPHKDGRRLWVGSQTGLSLFEPGGRFHPVALNADANGSYIQRVLTDSKGVTWVVSRGGVHQLDANDKLVRTWRHDARDPASIADNWGFCVLETRDGVLWFGTDNGLDRFDRASGSFTHFRHDAKNAASLSHNRVHYLLQARDGTVWAGTAGGLNRVKFGKDGQVAFQFYSLSAGTTADPIGAVLEDKLGHLWVSTTSGITRFDPKSGKFKNYTSRDGLVDGSFFIGSGYAAPNGTLYLGGLNGMNIITPESIHDNPFAPTVVLTDLLVFNQSIRKVPPIDGNVLAVPVQDTPALTLSYRNSVLSFEFAALHYADPQRNRYAYQLEGFDRDWVETDASKRFATYTNLEGGTYTFRVKASNKDGVWNETGARIELTVTPPLWKTWWFRLGTLSLLLGAGYIGYQLRIRTLLRQQHLLEAEVGARTEELMQKNASVERQKENVELAHRNISLLSEIGRTLTAKLDSEQIMLILFDRVNELMDASVFGIGFYRPDQGEIYYPFAIEMGKRYAPYSRSMSEPNQLAVWCVVNEKEVFINDLHAQYRQYIETLAFTSSVEDLGTLDDGSLPTEPNSLLYVPIIVGERMMGVISVHSYQKNAYQPIHLDMLRTLASYVGVAFDNADAYRQLKDTQQQLVAQEKMAALGSLVAGVAHELNTPIGNSLLMASTLQDKTQGVSRLIAEGAIKKSDLSVYIAASQEASTLIMRSLNNAADLVNSFKQVAVDQASAQRRRFNLAQTCHEITATMMNTVRKAGHNLALDLPPAVELDSFPGPFGQVLINLINNALLHAFDGRSNGDIHISATTPVAERVLLRFSDNGVGIAPEHLARIFDPFFTTKMGQGGSGLGLNITYNIVTGLLGGHIRVESAPGRGTVFYLDLPLIASAA